VSLLFFLIVAGFDKEKNILDPSLFYRRQAIGSFCFRPLYQRQAIGSLFLCLSPTLLEAMDCLRSELSYKPYIPSLLFAKGKPLAPFVS